jgi:phosphate transport system substrate-binding protein
MNFNPRRILIALLAFGALLIPAVAQEASEPTVTGSAIAAQAYSAALGAAEITPAFSEDFQGTNRGLGLLCQNAADIALTTRPMREGDTVTCNANSTAFVETFFAVDGLAFIVSPDVDFLSCVGQSDLDQIFAPSAASLTNWSAVNATYADLPLAVVTSGLGSRPFAAIDTLVRGDGLRADLETLADSAAVIESVAAGSGKLGVISLAAATTAEGVTVLDYRNPELNLCIAPTLNNVLNTTYTLGDRLFAYTAAPGLEKPGVTDALSALVSEAGQAALADAEFLAVGADIAAEAATVISEGQTGRVFSLDQAPFVPTPGLTSEFAVAGGGAGLALIRDSLTQFAQRNPTVTIAGNYLGSAAGANDLCSGAAALIITDAPLNAEQAAACEEAGITTVSFPLAAAAAVVIRNSNAAAEFECFTTEALASLWQASAEEAPESSTILLANGYGDPSLNLLLARVAGGSAIARAGLNLNADPLYNAAAVGVVEDALAVLAYADYLAALDNGQENIEAVGVDAGSGCVLPTDETIFSGEYPLASPILLIATQEAMYDDAVQAALWYVLSNANYANVQSASLLGLDLDGLPGLRVALKAAFDSADAIEAEAFAAAAEAAAAEATATAEAVGTPMDEEEATAEATPQP